jgi:hypothetical protein
MACKNLKLRSVPTYPFTPKSTAQMAVVQFWSIPLPGNYYACGIVLQFKKQNGRRDSRIFLAGLLEIGLARLLSRNRSPVPPSWFTVLPTSKTISANNGQILGCRNLDIDGIVIGAYAFNPINR